METNLEFSSLSDFEQWKNEIEKNTKSKFVQETGCKRRENDIIRRFVCHRSGEFVSKSNGERHIKTQGSNKIGGYCPAGITATYYDDGRCDIFYRDTDVGHENDLGHLWFTQSEREAIAANIPFNIILNDVRDSVSESSLECIPLLTRKELHNIEATFNLQSSVIKHQKDAISVDAWVAEMEGKDAIVIYKHQDSVSVKYPELKKTDLLLGLMNDAQTELLKKIWY
ncbi:MULE domain-containing protein [Trichonephila clavipes]|nr:MULE domain-containing protein [Trichonephila clavipes]